MRTLAVMVAMAATVGGQAPADVEFQYLYTFGSKHGIHPSTILNRRLATSTMGRNGDFPYGLGFPVGVTTDLRHRVWITDSGTASIHIFDTTAGAYREIRRAGEIVLQQPSGIVADPQGRIYVTDTALGNVVVFDEKGEYDHKLFKRGERFLDGPTAIALSEDNRTIYVADPPKNAVVELNREGEVNGTIPLPTEFGDPAAISVVSNQIYVLSNRQHRVAIFSASGRQRGELRWEGIRYPSAFTYDAGQRRFLVANPKWTVVEIFNEDGRSLGAFGQQGDGVDQMERVDSVHVDPRGLIYLVDSHHGKVLVFSASQAGLSR
jgi:DNA-binding beta-propeller fold protein YncE